MRLSLKHRIKPLGIHFKHVIIYFVGPGVTPDRGFYKVSIYVKSIINSIV